MHEGRLRVTVRLNVGAIQSPNTRVGRTQGLSSFVSTTLARRDQWYVPLPTLLRLMEMFFCQGE